MSKYTVKRDLEKVCPHCRTPIKRKADFCLSCGDFIEPIFLEATTFAVGNSFPRRQRNKERTPVQKIVLVLTACFLLVLSGIFVFTLLDCLKCLEPKDSKQALAKGGKYLQAGETDKAVNLLESSLSEDRRALCIERQVLLDRALHAHAVKLAQQQNFREAATFLSRISPSYEKHYEVGELLNEYQEKSLQHVFGGASIGGSGVDLKSRAKTDTRIDKAVSTAVHKPVGSEPAKIDESRSAITPNSVEPALKPSGIKSSARSGGSMNEAPISRYNSILADYFSSPKKSSAGDGESGPPSFEEWMKSGQPNF